VSAGAGSPPRPHRALAPAKINLGLFIGPVRAADHRHELASVMQSISLADELTLEPVGAGVDAAGAGGGRDGREEPAGDELVCGGVSGAPEDNLAAIALRMFRERTGWRSPPLRLSIVKRIPVAAGLGGGSADAAATLRLAQRASGLGEERLLLELAEGLGADVPAQVAPGRWLARGAGERLRPLPPPRSKFGVLVLASTAALSTAAVYAQADRLAAARERDQLERLSERLRAAFADGAPLPADGRLLHNDLQEAAVSLCPPIASALAAVRDAGAAHALVSGSGPTVLGLFPSFAAAQAAASRLGAGAICAEPVDVAFARPVALPVLD